jgi:hypothetical protein
MGIDLSILLQYRGFFLFGKRDASSSSVNVMSMRFVWGRVGSSDFDLNKRFSQLMVSSGV